MCFFLLPCVQVWKLISGTDGGLNCLTYAASVEGDQSKAYDESSMGGGGDNIKPTAESKEESRLGNDESKTPEDIFDEEERVEDNAAVFNEVLEAVDKVCP